MKDPERKKRKHEVEEVEVRSTSPTPVIYDVVCKMGEEEMERPVTSLWWSGFAAGLSISFSLLAQSILRIHLPDAPWRLLVTSFGYSDCVAHTSNRHGPDKLGAGGATV